MTFNKGQISLITLLAFGLFVPQTNSAPDASPPKGFQSGAPIVPNPFANLPSMAPKGTQPKAPKAYDDEDDDVFGMAPPSAAKPGIKLPGTEGPPSDVPNPVKGPQGIAVGGSPKGGVVETTSIDPLKVDTDSGVGSKEVVTDFNYPDADIMDIAKTIGKLTGKNFILDNNVKGRITIISNTPITVGDAWRAFLTALDINGFALIPSGSHIRIARQRDARDKQVTTYTGTFTPNSDALVTHIFHLKYISAEEVARTIRSFIPPNSRVLHFEQTNTVIVTDTGTNINRIAQMLAFLDVEGFDAGIEVLAVKFASAVELSKLIDTLLPGTGAAPAGAANKNRPRVFGRDQNFAARRTKEGGIINTIIADERTNNLIIHANSKGVDQVRELIAKLDKKLPSQVGGGKIHVTYLQFANAKKIAETLNSLSQTDNRGGGNRAAAGTGVNPTENTLFEGQIRVSADEPTNSLVITASPSDFATVQRVISKLDIPRDEVYVEVVIMEMSLSKNFNFSANAIAPNLLLGSVTNTDLLDFIQSPLASKGLTLGFGAGGTTEVSIGGQKVPVSSVGGLIKLIQTNSNSNILATPQILTLDNEKAIFSTAEKIPVPSTTVSQGIATANITKERIALQIEITPQINKISNFVKLDIKANMEDISGRELPSQVAQQAFATFERSAETKVVVADSDTVVLGGLVRDKVSETVSKVPILGDIPLLGWLFRAKRTETAKTNLLLFITPHIIRQYDKVRTILDKKLQARDKYIEETAGGEDPHRGQRDEMIRSLPDLKKILTQERDERQIQARQEAQEDFGGETPLVAPVAPAPNQIQNIPVPLPAELAPAPPPVPSATIEGAP